MTIWDKIYKNYKSGGEAWATLNEGVLLLFSRFIDTKKFDSKVALDIGCGNGKYLYYLKNKGFNVFGLDSSKTAVEMSRELLGDDKNQVCLADMFNYDIAHNKYDLIFSISTIHHGLKKEVIDLINKIYYKLKPGGFVYITLPDINSHRKWETFKGDNEVASGTYAPTSGPEKDLPHSFFSKEEIKKIFFDFKNIDLKIDEKGKWNIIANK